MKSLFLKKSQIKFLLDNYPQVKPNNEFILAKIKIETEIITIYHSQKTVFEYPGKFYQKFFLENNSPNIIGCDETGVGDLFLPLTVSAVHINERALQKIIGLPFNITDSKKLNLNQINHIYEILNDEIDHHEIIISNEQYNEFVKNGFNAHEIKTFAHLQCLKKLLVKNLVVDKIILDEYASMNNLKKYIAHLKMDLPKNLELHTKADNKFIAVSLASIFATFQMQVYKKKLESQLKIPINPGSGKDALVTAHDLINKYNKNILHTYAKTSFKNINFLL